jgi:hypothetical protein
MVRENLTAEQTARVDALRAKGWRYSTLRADEASGTPEASMLVADDISALKGFQHSGTEADDDYLGRDFAHSGSIASALAAVFAGIVSPTTRAAYNAFRSALAPAITAIKATLPTTRKRIRFDVEGEEPRIDRYLSGVPEVWERRERGAQKVTVKLGVRGSQVWGTSENDFIKNASIACAAAEVLTSAGYNVEVLAIAWTGRLSATGSAGIWEGIQDFASVIPLKRSDKPIDVSAILALAHPAMTRIATFGLREEFGLSGGLGTSAVPCAPEIIQALGIDALVANGVTLPSEGGSLAVAAVLSGLGEKIENALASVRPPEPEADAQTAWADWIARLTRELAEQSA